MSLFDGLELNTETPFRVNLLRPDKTPLLDADKNQAYIDVISTDSKRAEDARRARRDKVLANPNATPAEAEAFAVDFLANLTTGWYLVRYDGKPLLDESGAPIPFTAENAKALYANTRTLDITEQVRRAAASRENFTPRPSAA